MRLNLVFVVFILRLMDAGRLFYTDTASAMKKDHMVPVLKSFTQVRDTNRSEASAHLQAAYQSCSHSYSSVRRSLMKTSHHL